MALDLVGGSLFTLLYDGVKQAMVKTTQFKSLLADLKSTLDSLQPRIVEQIGEHNTELGLPNEEIQDLQRQMEEGVKLVRKFSEFRMWNYCCIGDYTDQLIELDRALRKLLEMLRLQEARDVKETLLLSRQNRDKLDEVNRRLIEIQNLLMQQQQKAGDVTEALDSGNNGETVPEPIQGNGIQVAALDNLDGGDALKAVFGMLFDAVLEVEDKAVMFKAPLGDLKSTLDSLKPLIEEIAQHNKVLVRPTEELEKITIHMEKGVELIPKCSKVRPWARSKKSTYTEKLLGLDKFLQRELYILKRQVARDVRSTIVSIRNVEMAIKQIEESGVLPNQNKGFSAVTEPSLPTLGLDVVLNVEGTRDVEETMVSIRNTEAEVQPIESSGVLQNQIQTKGFSVVAEPSPPTLGLDVALNVERTRDVEETMISIRNTEAGVKPIEESGVVQNQLETKGTKNASEDYTLVSRISRIFRRNISDTSSSAGKSLFSEVTKSTFLSEDDQSTDGHILETLSYLRDFRFAKLKTATSNFSPDKIIGQGGFGTVFRGWLDGKTLAPSKAGTGMIVAIKRFSESIQAAKECALEVKFLGRLSHPNLVKLLGYCFEKKKTLLVYEFVQRGSLDTHLFRRFPPDKEPLSWDNRYKIAIGAARGLTFLHSLQIIHRGVKPSNILLDEDYNPKISGFSLAKWGPADGDSHVSTRVCGTVGYLDPEYVMTGHLSVKSDVYSFGVVLLEILTGFDVNDRSSLPEEEFSLVYWAIPLLSKEAKLQTMMDTHIEGQYSPQEALQTAHLALKCLQRDPERRPSMEEVVEELACIQAMKEKPNQSDPFVEEAALRATAARLHEEFYGQFRQRLDEEVEVSGCESDGSLEGR